MAQTSSKSRKDTPTKLVGVVYRFEKITATTNAIIDATNPQTKSIGGNFVDVKRFAATKSSKKVVRGLILLFLIVLFLMKD